MAKMRTKISDCVSEGETLVWRYMDRHFSDEYWVWMNTRLMIETSGRSESNEIDLIIYHPEIGILVFSIKDWRVEHIREITKNRVALRSGQIKGHPYLNAEQHRYCLQNKLKRKEFLDAMGRPQLSVNAGVILPYISKSDFMAILPNDPTDVGIRTTSFLFCDDLTESAPLSNSTQCLVRLKNVRDQRYRWVTPLEQSQLSYLDELLGTPPTESEMVEEFKSNDAFTRIDNSIILKLDEKQKELAHKYLEKFRKSPGHSLVKGVAGSGKTVLLQYIFAELAKIPENKILLVVYTNALARSIKESLVELGIPIEHPNYAVETYNGLLSRIFGWRNLQQFRAEGEYYDQEQLHEYIASQIDAGNAKGDYDYVLIDEGQDFHDQGVRLIVNQAKDAGNVVYTEDYEQNLYGTKRVYADAGLSVRGQGQASTSLLINYRNTKQISRLALTLSNKMNIRESDSRVAVLRDGKEPEIVRIDTPLNVANKAWEQILKWEEIGYEPGSIAIIYPSFSRYGVTNHLLNKYAEANKRVNVILSGAGRNIPYPLFTNNNYVMGTITDMSMNKVTTLQSSKGLDFDCVVLIYENLDKRSEDWKSNGLYVGITRARSELMLVLAGQ